MSDLREQVIRLAYNKRHLRTYLLPLVAEEEEDQADDDDAEDDSEDKADEDEDVLVVKELGEGGIDENEIRNVLAIPKEDSLSDHYTPSQAVAKLIEKLGQDEAQNVISWTATMTHAPFYQQMEDQINAKAK